MMQQTVGGSAIGEQRGHKHIGVDHYLVHGPLPAYSLLPAYRRMARRKRRTQGQVTFRLVTVRDLPCEPRRLLFAPSAFTPRRGFLPSSVCPKPQGLPG